LDIFLGIQPQFLYEKKQGKSQRKGNLKKKRKNVAALKKEKKETKSQLIYLAWIGSLR
jgi:hypothetical protein